MLSSSSTEGIPLIQEQFQDREDLYQAFALAVVDEVNNPSRGRSLKDRFTTDFALKEQLNNANLVNPFLWSDSVHREVFASQHIAAFINSSYINATSVSAFIVATAIAVAVATGTFALPAMIASKTIAGIAATKFVAGFGIGLALSVIFNNALGVKHSRECANRGIKALAETLLLKNAALALLGKRPSEFKGFREEHRYLNYIYRDANQSLGIERLYNEGLELQRERESANPSSTVDN